VTRQELEQIRSLTKEIKLIQDDLDNLPFVPSTVKGSMPEFPYIEQHYKIIGPDKKKGERLKAKMERKLDELQDKLLELETWLDTVPDSEIRTILRMRYRNGLKDPQIATELGYSRSAISMKVKRFFDELNCD
jgi:DNA-directed RNA polymerase specialized sigma subunit